MFGSLVHDAWFTPWSDIDLAAWGISPERFYGAVAAITGLSPTFRIEWASQHQDALLRDWQLARDEKPPAKIAPLV